MLKQALDVLLGPVATAAKQSLFGPVAQIAIYTPAAIWLIAHRDDTAVCLSFGQLGLVVLFFAWSGWILTQRRPTNPP